MTKRPCVYILSSYKRTLYIGVTSNLPKRLQEHADVAFKCAFTKRYRIIQLVWVQEFPMMIEAITAEKQIKRWRRGKKIALIEQLNPEWKDLSKA